MGQSAPPEFLQLVTYVAYNHHPKISRLDTIRAYMLGGFYFVEVRILFAWVQSFEPSISQSEPGSVMIELIVFFSDQVDIELPDDMLLREAHDIGETLQNKLEALPEVERAYVHLDFECGHKPEHDGGSFIV